MELTPPAEVCLEEAIGREVRSRISIRSDVRMEHLETISAKEALLSLRHLHRAWRFTPPERPRIVESCLNSGSCTGSTEEVLETGLASHRAFFVWWHGLIAAQGWSAAENYNNSIADRVCLVADTRAR